MCYHKLNGIQIGASPSRGETTLIFTKKKTKKMEKGFFFSGNYQGGGVKPQVDTDDETPSGVSPRRRFATSLT